MGIIKHSTKYLVRLELNCSSFFLFPYMCMKNFEITDKETGKKYWVSRSMATMCVVVGRAPKTGTIRVLVERRGPGCPDNVGKLVVPCGYLDFGETLKESAAREVYEETGLKINPTELIMTGISDSPSEGLQNVTVRFTAQVPLAKLKVLLLSGKINSNTKSRGGENNEVSELLLVSPYDIYNSDPDEWAFNHKKIILETLQRYYDK